MSKESTSIHPGGAPTTPNWDKLQLSEEYLNDLKKLKDDQAKLQRICATGLAIITFMDSPLYADSYGPYLQDAFWRLCHEAND